MIEFATKCYLCGKEMIKGGYFVPRFWEQGYSTSIFHYVNLCRKCLEHKINQPKAMGPTETKEVENNGEKEKEARAE